MHSDPRQVPALARLQAWIAPNANLWGRGRPQPSLRAGRTECCTGLPPTPGTVSQLFPLDFLLHALRQSYVLRTGQRPWWSCWTPLVIGAAVRKASAGGCDPCPGIAGGNEPLADQIHEPHRVAVLAECISASSISCD